jgi:PAS domain S-box-containing protein/putative nucleotidyltransferase with HDIG domain
MKKATKSLTARINKKSYYDLKQAHGFLSNILDSSSSISIISTDRKGKIDYWNIGAEKMFGYKAREVEGKKNIGILYPDNRIKKEMVAIRNNIFRHRKGYKCENREVTKDGRTLWVSMTLTPRMDENRKITGIVGIGEDITERKRAQDEVSNSLKKLRRSLDGTIRVMIHMVETRDPYTAGHQRRVANLAFEIAREMGLPEERIDGLHMAALIHDIGKISVPAELLNRPGWLTDMQYGMIKTHPQVGYDILKDIEFPWPIADMIIQHHERLDGSGYPSGLKGDEIILEARILAVADVVEAIASHRPYRAALGLDKAFEEISGNKGKLYDPRVVNACKRLFNKRGFRFE